MISPTTYLDLYDIFFNEIVGDLVLGIIIGLLLIWINSAKQNMSLQLSLFFAILFLSIVFLETRMAFLWLLVVTAVGVTFYYKLSKLVSRGG